MHRANFSAGWQRPDL